MFRKNYFALLTAALALSALPGFADTPDPDDNGIELVLIHPPFLESFNCTEHWEGQLPYLGDALGTDCVVATMVEEDDRQWMRAHEGAGLNNEDWFGYGADVLAPCDCTVVKVQVNATENLPGVLGEPPATFIVFRRADNTSILIAHLKDLQVAEGDEVIAGEVVATVGNNGFSRQPHIHIGAWRDETALQIRFDQTRMRPGDEEHADEQQ